MQLPLLKLRGSRGNADACFGTQRGPEMLQSAQVEAFCAVLHRGAVHIDIIAVIKTAPVAELLQSTYAVTEACTEHLYIALVQLQPAYRASDFALLFLSLIQTALAL